MFVILAHFIVHTNSICCIDFMLENIYLLSKEKTAKSSYESIISADLNLFCPPIKLLETAIGSSNKFSCIKSTYRTRKENLN